MSLIDEALKRAQAAHQAEQPPVGGSRPWTPVPLPDRSEARRRRTLRVVVFVAVAVSIAAGTWLLRPSKGVSIHENDGGRGARPPAAAVLPTPLPEAIVAPPSRGVSAPSALSAPGPSMSGRLAGSPERGPASSPRVAAPAGSSAGASEPPARPSTTSLVTSTSLINGHTYVGSITLPGGSKIELGGIVYSDTNATALVNGRPVGTGATVEGFAIVKIEPGRLELEGNGLTIFLALNK